MTGEGGGEPRGRGAAIEAAGWGYTYPGRPQPALRDVVLSLEPGALVVLMGPSGSGKSTLLGALAGTLPQGGSTGRLQVGRTGSRPDPASPGAPAAGPAVVGPGAIRVGLVQQEPEANVVMERVGDDLAFPLENAAVPVDRIWPRVAAALGAVGLEVPLDRPTSELSGGQQQLLAVAAAAVAGPDLLLLDEPTANLDGAAAGDVLRAVDWVRRSTGCTVVVVEHRVEPWLARADRVLLVESGEVTSLAPADLPGYLAARPGLASRVWVDHRHLPDRAARSEPGEPALSARGITVAGRLAATDLDVRSGEVVALTGPPGSGKSTLLAVLAGLLRPTSGTVEARCGTAAPDGPEPGSVRADPWRWAAADIAASFGVVFQNPEHQFLAGRVDDELQHGLRRAGLGRAQAAQRAASMLDRLHLAELAAVNPFTLSGGQQRRLSVGTALILDPRVLMLDEPTFGQDPATWAEVVDIVAGHRDAGGSVVLATHDPHLVAALGAREVRLGDREVAAGPAHEQRDAVRWAPPAAEAPTAPPPSRGLRGLDPLALLGAALMLSVAALVSGSVLVNVALALVAVLGALAGGLPARRVGWLALPAVVACASVGLSNALLSDAGLASASAWSAAALPASRVLAVALPGLVAAVAIDPTALADALVVRLRVPARAAYSVLAGLRLLPLLSAEWSILARASRARGLGGTGLRARAGEFASMTMRLLVAALRRGGRLAVALEARGLRSDTPRTVARPPRWRGRDSAALLLGGVVVLLAAATRLG